MGSRRLRLLVLLLSAGSLVAAPVPALATDLGQLRPSPPSACVDNGVGAQDSVGGPPAYSVPAGGGVLTSWSTRTDEVTGKSLKFKLLRRDPAASNMLTTVVETSFQALAPNRDNTFPIGPPAMAAREGDVLGVTAGGSGAQCLFTTTNSGDRVTAGFADAPPGSSAEFGLPAPSMRLNLLVTLEPDADGDQLGDDTQDADDDGDGRADGTDNCRLVANPDQANLDGDSQGDACDADDDGDGLSDFVELATGSDPRKADSDGDGRPDGADPCPTVAGACVAADSRAPGVRVSGVPARIARSRLLRRGLAMTLAPDEPAAFNVRLLGRLRGPRVARAGDVVLAERSTGRSAAKRTLRLKMGRALGRRLARRSRLRLEIRATDGSGNVAVARRRISVR